MMVGWVRVNFGWPTDSDGLNRLTLNILIEIVFLIYFLIISAYCGMFELTAHTHVIPKNEESLY
jgi:hypothetical protein